MKPSGVSESGVFTLASMCHLRTQDCYFWTSAAVAWSGRKESLPFVTAISVSGECDIRGRQVRESHESDLWTHCAAAGHRRITAPRVHGLHEEKAHTQVSACRLHCQTGMCLLHEERLPVQKGKCINTINVRGWRDVYKYNACVYQWGEWKLHCYQELPATSRLNVCLISRFGSAVDLLKQSYFQNPASAFH